MNKRFILIKAALLALSLLVLDVIAGVALAVPPSMLVASSSGTKPMPPAAMVLQQMHMVNQFEIKAAKLAEKKATTTRIRRYADRLRRDHENADGKVKDLAMRLGYPLHRPEQMRQIMMQMQHQPLSGASGMAPGASASMPIRQKMPMPSASATMKPASGGASPAMPPIQKMQKLQKIQAMMQMMQQAMTRLQSTSGPQFDRAYLMVMVTSHQKAIGMLEKVQAKGLDQPQVTGLIRKLLPILKQHLQLAQGLQKRMAG